MQLGIIGLGRMGGNIARRLMLNGHTTVVYDRNEAFVKGLSEEGATGAADLKALVAGLQKPRARLGDVAGRRPHRKHHQ